MIFTCAEILSIFNFINFFAYNKLNKLIIMEKLIIYKLPTLIICFISTYQPTNRNYAPS
jgi:hypothetical protein